MNEEEKPTAVLDGAEIKTLTRSEQRKKNRLEHRHKARKETAPGAEAGGGNIFRRAYQFLVEAKEELGRVIWPTRKETVDSTWRLLILVIIVGVYLALVDGLLTRLLGLIA